MARNLQVLLLNNVDGTGIVGDVVNVRKGFFRNYLAPRGIATAPDEKLIKELQLKRKDAIKLLASQRKGREDLIAKLAGVELTLVRSCNDVGILYAAVTQQEIADELAKAGFKGVLDREVRLGQPIKRLGDYSIAVKFSMTAIPDEDGKGKAVEAASLESEIKIHVKPDRELELTRREKEAAEEAAAAAEGGEKRQKDKGATFATEKPKQPKEDLTAKPKTGWGAKPSTPEVVEKPVRPAKADKGEKADKKK
jgi:large subunit ribosomal protein L9